MKIPLNKLDQHLAFDSDNGAEYRNFYKVYT